MRTLPPVPVVRRYQPEAGRELAAPSSRQRSVTRAWRPAPSNPANRRPISGPASWLRAPAAVALRSRASSSSMRRINLPEQCATARRPGCASVAGNCASIVPRCSANAFNPARRPPLQHHTELVQQPTQRIDRCRANAHPVLARCGAATASLAVRRSSAAPAGCRLCCAANQMARASAASSLLLRTNGRTCLGGSNCTSWPSRGKRARPVMRAATRLHHDAQSAEAAQSDSTSLTRATASCGRSRRSLHPPNAAASRSWPSPRHTLYDSFRGLQVEGCLTHNPTLALDAVRREAPPRFSLHKPYSRPSKSASAFVSGWEASIHLLQ